MWQLKFMSAFFLSMLAVMAEAAEITVKATDKMSFIYIKGPIVSSDLDKFRQVSIEHKEAIIVLESEGGELLPALEIGKIIRIAGYSTFIDRADCVSSCALIWVAGSQRYLNTEGNVGFHASYRNINGKLEESGVANALIGNYLALLNLQENAVVFATSASPDEILWLTKDNRGISGINFNYIGDEAAKKETPVKDKEDNNVVVNPPSTVRPQRLSNPLPKHLPTELSANGENWIRFSSDAYYDTNSIKQIVDTNGIKLGKQFWSIIDDQKNKKSNLR